MEILYQKDYRNLLGYLPHVKLSLKDWLFVDVRLTEAPENHQAITEIADVIRAAFDEREGKVFVCNKQEILMIIRWSKELPSSIIADGIGQALPDKQCEIYVHEPTMVGLSKLEVLITYKKPLIDPMPGDIRATRRANSVVVADDDMYMRSLVRKSIGPSTSVYEVADGKEVLPVYMASNPDVLFLDIHMPNAEGTDVLQDILRYDPKAYVVMLSADSSQENVRNTTHKGAKGFLTKPFTKEKLQEYLNKCPTFS